MKNNLARETKNLISGRTVGVHSTRDWALQLDRGGGEVDEPGESKVAQLVSQCSRAPRGVSMNCSELTTSPASANRRPTGSGSTALPLRHLTRLISFCQLHHQTDPFERSVGSVRRRPSEDPSEVVGQVRRRSVGRLCRNGPSEGPSDRSVGGPSEASVGTVRRKARRKSVGRLCRRGPSERVPNSQR